VNSVIAVPPTRTVFEELVYEIGRQVMSGDDAATGFMRVARAQSLFTLLEPEEMPLGHLPRVRCHRRPGGAVRVDAVSRSILA